MAQESNNNNNNNNNNKNNVSIPDQISWNSNSEKPVYRGATAIQSVGQSENFGIAKSFGKNASSSTGISMTSEITGGAIDIDFIGNGNGIKSSYPSIEPIGNRIKPQEPLLQIVEDNINQQQQQQQKPNIDEAPAYDGFQPHCAHYSKMDPIKLNQTINNILIQLVQNGDIDYYQTSPFVVTYIRIFTFFIYFLYY